MKLAMTFCAALLGSAVSLGGCGTSTKATGSTTSSAELAELSKQVKDLDTRLQKIETLLAQYLEEQPEPDPQAVYSVPIDGLPYAGAQHAKVTIVKAYEFACGFCARAVPTMEQLLKEYEGKIKVVYAPYIVHADVAIVPALAVCAAEQQGKFREMSTLIWEKGFAQRDLSEARMTALANELNLDMEKYKADASSPGCMETLQRSAATLQNLGTSGTPTFYINGRYLVGAQPVEMFRTLIDEELAKADKAIAAGTPVESYYQKTVVEAGKKTL